MPPAAHELRRARAARDMPQHIVGKRRGEWRPLIGLRSVHRTRFANDTVPRPVTLAPRRRKREQHMRARPPRGRIHQRRPPDGNRRDRDARSASNVRCARSASSIVAKPQIDVRGNRHIPARTRSRRHSPRHARATAVRSSYPRPPSAARPRVRDRAPRAATRARAARAASSAIVVHADALAGRQVPRMRGRIRIVAVMEESAHAARNATGTTGRISQVNRGRASRECAVSSDRRGRERGAFWNAARDGTSDRRPLV